ncbi:MAG TPA: adenylate/guanylate cyclase domain-containing protein [Chroococcales cyanobacterium]
MMHRTLKRKIWDWRRVWITAPTIAGIVLALRLFGWLQIWEWAALDQFLRWRPREPVDDRIVIVAIDEVDLKKIGQWPIPDAVLAELIETIKAQKPRAIGLDLYRNLPVQPGHSALRKVFETTPNLIGIELINGEDKSSAIDPSPVLAERDQVGCNNVVVDIDGKLRRGLLSMFKHDQPIPSFSMVLASMYLEAYNVVPQPTQTNPQVFRWGKALFHPFTPHEGGYRGADAGGYQILLNYRGPAGSFRSVSLRDVLNNKISPKLMRDRIVLIGATAISLNDFFYTPYSSDAISGLRLPIASPERTPGVEVQANIISQILSATLEGRPLIQTWPKVVDGVWIFLWSFVGATLAWQGRHTGGVRSLLFQRSTSPILTAGILVVVAYAAFLGGWWIPMVPPFLALSGSAIAITAYIARTAREIRKTFGRYLTDSVVAQLLESPEGLQLGGENREVTILTSDLRGFTLLSERLQPQEIVKILNIYLGCMADVISQYQGTIDEFMGDGILVVFGAPTAREDDAVRAVACAIAMQLEMTLVNEEMERFGFPKLEMGIGISTGFVVVGNIGSEKRAKYSVIGKDVNLAFRIESYTVGGQILISESTLKKVESIARIDGQKRVRPKGMKQPIPIYDVGGIGGNYHLFLSKTEESFFPLTQLIPVQYSLLDGKRIDDLSFPGTLVKLSNNGAEVRCEHLETYAIPKPLSNIKLNLLMSNNSAEMSEDIYAKVVEKIAEPGRFYIYFTTRTPEIKAKLDSLYQRAKTNYIGQRR